MVFWKKLKTSRPASSLNRSLEARPLPRAATVALDAPEDQDRCGFLGPDQVGPADVAPRGLAEDADAGAWSEQDAAASFLGPVRSSSRIDLCLTFCAPPVWILTGDPPTLTKAPVSLTDRFGFRPRPEGMARLTGGDVGRFRRGEGEGTL